MVAVGTAVFAPLALLEAGAGVAIADGVSAGGGRWFGAVALWLAVSLSMLGSALCTGFLDKLVGKEFGHHDASLGEALRTIPYGRLVALDLTETLILALLTVVLLLPGVIMFTLTALAASILMLENRSVGGSLRRSSSLVTRHAVTTALVVTLPVFLEHQVLHAVEAIVELRFLALWLLHTVVAVMVLVPVVLCEITLAYSVTGHAGPARPGSSHPAPSATA